MTISARMLEADFRRAIADWGRRVTHQRVTTTVDLPTLTATEAMTAKVIEALVMEGDDRAVPDTGGQARSVTHTVLVWPGDLPSLPVNAVERFVIDERHFDVTARETLGSTGLLSLRLECRD